MGSVHRYIGGKLPAKYFHDDVWPVFEELFEKLCIDELLGTKIFQAFCAMDKDESGTVDIDECMAHFGGARTRYNERIFYHEEKLFRQAGDNSRGFNFKDFAMRVWNYNTYTTEQILVHVWEIFDVNQQNFLERYDIETMYKMLYDCDDHDPKYIGECPYEDDCIKREDFIKYFSNIWRKGSGHLIYPALQFQSRLRGKTGGFLAWETVSAFRIQHFSGYDNNAKTQAEALAGIIASEDLNKRRKLEDAEKMLELERKRLKEIADKAQRDLEEREAQIIAEIAAKEAVAPDRFMKRAFKQLEKIKEEFESLDFSTEDTKLRHHKRQAIYKAYDKYNEEALKFYAIQDAEILGIAVGTDGDHQSRLKDYLATEVGRLHKRRMFLHLALKEQARIIEEKRQKNQGRRKKDTRTVNEMLVESMLSEVNEHLEKLQTYNDYIAKISAMSKEEAMEIPTVKPVKLKEFANELSFVESNTSNSDLAKYEKENDEYMFNWIRDKVINECKAGLAKDKTDREIELRKHEMGVMRYGSRITKWEYVRDKVNVRDCYVNIDTFEVKHYKTAFCENCDGIFEQSEMKCKGCKFPRSGKNMSLYRPLGYKDITQLEL